MSSLDNYSDDEEYIALEEPFNDDDSQIDNDEELGIEPSDDFRKQKISRKRKKSLSDLKTPRGKFSLRWEKDFPWVKADNINESLGVCTVCDKQLVCKRSHLERHEKSYKHQRFLTGIHKKHKKSRRHKSDSEIQFGVSEEDTTELDSLEVDPYLEEDLEAKSFNEEDKITINSGLDIEETDFFHEEVCRNSKAHLEREKILSRINRSRNELNDFYNRLKGANQPPSQPVIVAPSRDSFDLFFDSVSATVKTLPPKLASEMKSRVSQLIAEYELRAICEREAAMASAESMLSYEVFPKVQHVTSTTTIEGTGAQIVYTLPVKDNTIEYEQPASIVTSI